MKRTSLRSLAFILMACASYGGSGGSSSGALVYPVAVDASAVTGTLRPLWRDHYDLSFEHFDYATEAGFNAVLGSLAPRSWRCSVGRWEVGFPPPAGGDSLDPGVLAASEREFYRGPNTLVGADDPTNYEFNYLDDLLGGLVAAGAEPYLCFDYMPFSLAQEQDPANADNRNVTEPGVPFSTFSFSNGVRTSPPSDSAVYARVVRNTMRHTRGLFAGATDFGIEYFEIGNEPDAVDPAGNPLTYFWTGSELEFYDMYAAIAAEVDADAQLTGTVQLGAGSFAFLPTHAGVMFSQAFLVRVAAGSPRLDYLSFHTYGDLPSEHLGQFALMNTIATGTGVSVPWVNAEWGRALNGTSPVYDQIEHGLFRAQVLGLMQIYPFEIAHEELFRDPGTSGGELGLVRTGPAAHKPVSRVYQALQRMNDVPQALDVTANAGQLFLLAGSNAGGTRVALAIVVENSPAMVQLEIASLPWGVAPSDLSLSRVTQASADGGSAMEVIETTTGMGGQLDYDFDADAAGLYLLELDRQ